MGKAIAAALAAVSAIGLAAPAHADESEFIQLVRKNESSIFSNTSDSQLLRMGYAACQVLNAGGNLSQADLAVAQAGSSMGLQPGLAGSMYVSQTAKNYLC